VGLNGPNGILIATTDGHTWSVPSTQQVQMSGVSCWGIDQCVVSQLDGEVTILSPTFNQTVSSTGEGGRLFAISCPAAGDCFAAGDYGMVVSTADGGTGWALKPPAVLSDLQSIACPTSSLCYAGSFNATRNDAGLLVSSDGGATWEFQDSFSQVSLAHFGPSVSCPTATTCYATDYSDSTFSARIIKTVDGGSNWTAKDLTVQGPLQGITCPTTVVCYAYGEGVILTTTDGSAWLTRSAPSNSLFNGISCPTTTDCFAADFRAGFYLTTDGGSTWTNQATTQTGWRAISCPSTSVCFAAGDNGMAGTTNGGTTWINETPTGFSDSIFGLTCPTSTSCIAPAISGAIYATTDGSTWHIQTSGTTNRLTSVSCASTSERARPDGDSEQCQRHELPRHDGMLCHHAHSGFREHQRRWRVEGGARGRNHEIQQPHLSQLVGVLRHRHQQPL
jgi:photosystem II stability/assembly factor-like uncharacterized protein